MLNVDAYSLYSDLYLVFGETKWWPGETEDEIIVGAILTQNTAWSNVERSLARIREEGLMSLSALAKVDQNTLIELIRSSGFYNQKSRTVLELSHRIKDRFGTVEQMKKEHTDILRGFLIDVPGIGQETMDAILCYALDKPLFVVDKYALRILGRLGVNDVTTIAQVKNYVHSSIGDDLEKLKNFHGLFVNFAKEYCRSKPNCKICPLQRKCDYGLSNGN